MTEFEKFKDDVAKTESPEELVGMFEATKTVAALYCREEYPDEVIFENGRLEDISLYGLIDYFRSEVHEK